MSLIVASKPYWIDKYQIYVKQSCYNLKNRIVKIWNNFVSLLNDLKNKISEISFYQMFKFSKHKMQILADKTEKLKENVSNTQKKITSLEQKNKKLQDKLAKQKQKTAQLQNIKQKNPNITSHQIFFSQIKDMMHIKKPKQISPNIQSPNISHNLSSLSLSPRGHDQTLLSNIQESHSKGNTDLGRRSSKSHSPRSNLNLNTFKKLFKSYAELKEKKYPDKDHSNSGLADISATAQTSLSRNSITNADINYSPQSPQSTGPKEYTTFVELGVDGKTKQYKCKNIIQVLKQLVTVVENNITKEGLFRISPSQQTLDNVYYKLIKKPNDSTILNEVENIETLATSAIKKIFRELTPEIFYENQKSLYDVVNDTKATDAKAPHLQKNTKTTYETNDQIKDILKLGFHGLNETRREMLNIVIPLLKNIIKNENYNKMGLENIVIALNQALFPLKNLNLDSILEFKTSSQATRILITKFDYIIQSTEK